MKRIAPLIALLALSFARGNAAEQLKAGVFDPPRPAPNFALDGSDGNVLTLERYRGKTVLLGFGYTTCPDICPTTLAVLAEARKRLGADAENVQVVYVTVDPATDNAAQMARYLAVFDPTFVGGTGTAQRLTAVREQYGVFAASKVLVKGDAFSHSSFVYLIDHKGILRGLMTFGTTPDDYVHDLKILLAERG